MFGKEPTVIGGLLGAAVILLAPCGLSAQRSTDFDDLSLSPESFYNGSDQAGGFSSGALFFNNHYDPEFDTWGGWAYSNVTENDTGGFANQYAAITGGGIGGSGDIYAVGFMDTFTPAIPRIALPEGESPVGIQVTNTAYTYYSMLEGDDFAKKFGGESGDDPDFFRLTVTGLDADDEETGSAEVYLADYRFEDNNLDYIIDTWEPVDLSGLGAGTRVLEFTLDSSDTGVFGMNTPAYLALGEVTVVPESATFALWGGVFVVGLAGVRSWRRRSCEAPEVRRK